VSDKNNAKKMAILKRAKEMIMGTIDKIDDYGHVVALHGIFHMLYSPIIVSIKRSELSAKARSSGNYVVIPIKIKDV